MTALRDVTHRTAAMRATVLYSGDAPHGIVEGEVEDLDVEVNGVASQVAFGPAPVRVFDDEAGRGGQNKIARLAFDELESALLQERNQKDEPGGADLFAVPTEAFRRGVGHSLFSSKIG